MGRKKFLYTPLELLKLDDPSWNGSWENIDYDKKVYYVQESVKIFYNILDFQNEEVCLRTVRKTCKLSLHDRAIYLRHMNAPEVPPLKPSLFFKQQSEIKNNNISQNLNEDYENLFSKLSRAEKFKCYKKHIKALEFYFLLKKQWEEEQCDKLAKYFYEVYCKKQLYGISSNVSKGRIKTIKKVKHEVTETQIEMFTSAFKFPPMSVAKLVKKIKGPKELKKDMHQFLKILYFEIVNDIKKSFAKEILEYVDKLDNSDKKLFIGLNRNLYLSKFGGEDIFEKLYPSENFPAFIFDSLDKSLEIESDDEYFRNEPYVKQEVKLNVNHNIPEDFDPALAVQNSIRTLFENLNSKSKR